MIFILFSLCTEAVNMRFGHCVIMQIIGTSKVSTDLKVTLVKDVQQKLNAQRGDILAFYEDKGLVVIKIIKL